MFHVGCAHVPGLCSSGEFVWRERPFYLMNCMAVCWDREWEEVSKRGGNQRFLHCNAVTGHRALKEALFSRFFSPLTQNTQLFPAPASSPQVLCPPLDWTPTRLKLLSGLGYWYLQCLAKTDGNDFISAALMSVLYSSDTTAAPTLTGLIILCCLNSISITLTCVWE